MAMEEYGTMIMASRANALWDLRDVPLGQLNECAEAKQVVDAVMENAGRHAVVVVAGFNSAI
jgi:hypothetical protein